MFWHFGVLAVLFGSALAYLYTPAGQGILLLGVVALVASMLLQLDRVTRRVRAIIAGHWLARLSLTLAGAAITMAFAGA